ncbi:hypothetical protein KI387_029328, partial [Taxus chinensis]
HYIQDLIESGDVEMDSSTPNKSPNMKTFPKHNQDKNANYVSNEENHFDALIGCVDTPVEHVNTITHVISPRLSMSRHVLKKTDYH